MAVSQFFGLEISIISADEYIQLKPVSADINEV